MVCKLYINKAIKKKSASTSLQVFLSSARPEVRPGFLACGQSLGPMWFKGVRTETQLGGGLEPGFWRVEVPAREGAPRGQASKWQQVVGGTDNGKVANYAV